MPFKDLREFIDRLEKEEEVQRISEEVDWNLEAGAMLRRSAEVGLPAPFFQKVKGYPDRYTLFGGTFSKLKRIAIAMDMDPDAPLRELMEEYLRRRQNPIKPVLVNNGPCKENIQVGDEVDLLKFPVPVVHEGDGGRYIGTWHIDISKDLDGEWVNWGMYRHMLHNKNTIGISVYPHTHLGQMYNRHESINKPMEVAIAIGVDPILTFCAGNPVPYRVSEVDIAGGIRGKPVELIKCETVDLAVPATAEIVIEGEMRPYEIMDEGPFGEFTGYRTRGSSPKSVIHVKAITHRNNPIFTMSCMGVLVDDSLVTKFAMGVEFLEALRARGLPVTGVCVPPETSGLLTVVAVKTTYANIAEDVVHVVFGTSIGRAMPYIVVVNDDVDPFNLKEWLHALATKCHPYKGIRKIEHNPTSPLLPFLDQHERKHRIGAKAYFDCTWPLEWDPSEVPQKMSFATAYPLEIQQKALAKWHKYGY